MHQIHTAALDKQNKREMWETIIAEYEQLEISQRRFCEERGIKMDLFCYHYGRYKQRIKSQSQEKMSFISAFSPSKMHGDELRLIVRQDFEVHIPRDFDAQHLIKVLQTLRQVSC